MLARGGTCGRRDLCAFGVWAAGTNDARIATNGDFGTVSYGYTLSCCLAIAIPRHAPPRPMPALLTHIPTVARAARASTAAPRRARATPPRAATRVARLYFVALGLGRRGAALGLGAAFLAGFAGGTPSARAVECNMVTPCMPGTEPGAPRPRLARPRVLPRGSGGGGFGQKVQAERARRTYETKFKREQAAAEALSGESRRGRAVMCGAYRKRRGVGAPERKNCDAAERADAVRPPYACFATVTNNTLITSENSRSTLPSARARGSGRRRRDGRGGARREPGAPGGGGGGSVRDIGGFAVEDGAWTVRPGRRDRRPRPQRLGADGEPLPAFLTASACLETYPSRACFLAEVGPSGALDAGELARLAREADAAYSEAPGEVAAFAFVGASAGVRFRRGRFGDRRR